MSETTTKSEAASTFGMLSIAAPFIGGFIILILFWTDLIAPLLYIRIAFGALLCSPALNWESRLPLELGTRKSGIGS